MYNIKECTINNKHSYLLEYYNKIRSKEIIAGHELIQQIENLIDDLGNEEYIYDTKDAELRISFIERFCKHTKAPFHGMPFILELWEKAVIEAFFSFKTKEDGYRRFKKLILIIGRKNGKSTFAAALATTEFFCGTGGNDIICSSNTDEQASIIFDEINNMREMFDSKDKRSHKNLKGMINKKNKSTIKKLSDRTRNKEGRNIDFAILDESNEMTTNVIAKSIEQSQSTKLEPAFINITTEGFVNDGYLDKQLIYVRKVINKEIDDPTILGWLYTQDSEAEIWQDTKTWQKSNPSLGIIKQYKYIKDQLRVAQQDKSERIFTMAKDFNIKQNNAEAWLTPEEYTNEATYDIENLRGKVGLGAVDLSETTDLTSAKVLIMLPKNPNDEKSGQKKYILSRYFIPESKLDEGSKEDNIDYKELAKQGLITISPGNDNDFSLITAWFVSLITDYGIKPFMIGYDNALAKYWSKEMEDIGFTMEKIPQRLETLSNPMKLLEADLRSNLTIYNNNPLDKWCLGNTAIKIDPLGQIMPMKVQDQRNRRIDGAATMVMCYYMLMQHRTEYMNLVR